MNEKYQKILEQYDLEFSNMRRGRGSLILESDQGLYLLREYTGCEQRAEWIYKICQSVLQAGFTADCPVACREGTFLVKDRDERRYMLKKWVHAREMDVKNIEEIREAMKHLARLHHTLQGMEGGPERNDSLGYIYERRIRELRKIYRYICGKKRKNAYEEFFLRVYDRMLQPSVKALEMAGDDEIQRYYREAKWMGCVCHQEYNQHNVLVADNKKIVVVNFENCRIGVQNEDLYCFMRKILEKHNWDISLAKEMLRTYQMEHILSDIALKDLYLRFLFEEKFWKIANHYYNSGKNWIPDRSLQKMEKLMAQADMRGQFLDYFASCYM